MNALRHPYLKTYSLILLAVFFSPVAIILMPADWSLPLYSLFVPAVTLLIISIVYLLLPYHRRALLSNEANSALRNAIEDMTPEDLKHYSQFTHITEFTWADVKKIRRIRLKLAAKNTLLGKSFIFNKIIG